MSQIDRGLLAGLSAVAAWSTWSSRSAVLDFPKVFAVLHLVVAVALVVSGVAHRVTPYAVALAFGTFVGRAVALYLAMVLGTTQFTTELLAIAGSQWLFIAWIIHPGRPAFYTSPTDGG